MRIKGYGVIILLCACYWMIDSVWTYISFEYNVKQLIFSEPLSLMEAFLLKVPTYQIVSRLMVVTLFIVFGSIILEFLKARQKAEEDLRKSEGHLRAIYEAAKSVAFIITDARDPEPLILEFSPGAEMIFGYQKDEVLGKPVSMLHLPEDIIHFPRVHQQMREGRTGFSGETQLVKKSGETFPAIFTTYPLKGTRGEMYAALGVSFDISEQKRLEAQLFQSQKMESVGRLAGGIAHDFNNMLSIILGNTELVMDEINVSHPFYNSMEEIKKATMRSAEFVKQLLAFARKQAITPKVLDLNTTLKPMIAMLPKLIGEDIKLTFSPASELWPIRIDPSQVDQILTNLCANSRDAISGVGEISIHSKNITIKDDQYQETLDSLPGQYVMLMVTDNGCGMDQKTLDHLFEPFYTTKGVGKGSGLGLPMVYGIIKQNNGFVNVDSELNKGTTIKLYFPRYKAPDDDVDAENKRNTKGLSSNQGILLVEDEEAILRTAAVILERMGYSIWAAKSPFDAMGLFKDNVQDIQLLITDVVMPGMSGRDLAMQLTQIKPSLKCLFMSGCSEQVLDEKGEMAEDVHFIYKPFSRDGLVAKLNEILKTG